MTYLEHFSGNISNTTSPVSRRLVQDIVNTETAILFGKRVQVLPQKNIAFGDVGIDQVDLGLIASRSATDNSSDDLEHRGDTSASSDHTKVADHVGRVDKGTLGAPHANRLADSERSHVLGDVSGRVGLDQKVDVARLVVTRDGSVGTNDLLAAAIFLSNVGSDGDVLTDGQTDDRVGGGEFESVAVLS